METPLQQRIVGAIVIVALGVIFIPAILDGSGFKSRHTRTIEIPPQPVFPPPEKVSVVEVPTPLDDRLASQRQYERENPEPPEKLKPFMLQVGTFSSRENAEKLRNDLRGKGYTTHVYEETVDGKTVFPVRIGPEAEKDRIESIRKKLAKAGTEGFIIMQANSR